MASLPQRSKKGESFILIISFSLPDDVRGKRSVMIWTALILVFQEETMNRAWWGIEVDFLYNFGLNAPKLKRASSQTTQRSRLQLHRQAKNPCHSALQRQEDLSSSLQISLWLRTSPLPPHIYSLTKNSEPRSWLVEKSPTADRLLPNKKGPCSW